MSEKLALIELYEAAKRFEPVLRQHEAILLKVIFEVDGRNVIFNYDPKEVFSEPEREMLVPPPPPPPPVETSVPKLPVAAPTVSELPSRSSGSRAVTIMVDGFELPIPPVAMEKVMPQVSHPMNSKPKRTDEIEGILPLTDEDICPIAKKHPNTKLKDIPASYLDWLYGQPWLRTKHPRLWAYIARHEDVITKELKAKGTV
jgi:hypothetical protein